MACARYLAKKTSEVLDSIGYPCSRLSDTAFMITKLGVRVDVVEGKVNESPKMVAAFPTIVCSHPHLPHGFAQELGVGYGKTVEDAANYISASWMMLFFTPLKFLFEDNLHDCLVLEQDVTVPGAADEGYRIVAGPVQTNGIDGSAGHIGQTKLWDAVSDLLLPKIRHGVHHLRFFTGRTGQGVSGDVFLDGSMWEEGSERVRELAKTLPEPTSEQPMVTLKQHLFLRTKDIAASVHRAEQEKLQIWGETLAPRIDPKHKPLVDAVMTGLRVMSQPGTHEQHEQELNQRGVEAETAGRLINFLESAAARVCLEDRIGFCDTYFLVNNKTEQAVERRYDQTPVYMAAVQVCTILRSAGLAEDEIDAVASSSAEWNVLKQVMQKGTKPDGGKLTEMIHYTSEPVEGEKLSVLRSHGEVPPPEKKTPPEKKPWWRFW